jgi:peptide/nickel transport system permease protein
MRQYIARRILLFVPTMFLLTFLVFLFLRIIPGDPAVLILAGATGEGAYTPEDLAALQEQLGTNRHVLVQYGYWVGDLLQGDLGTSYFYGIPIIEELQLRLPLTLELTILGILTSFLLAVPLGIVSAIYQDTPIDYATRLISFTGIAIPTFVTGIVTIYLLVKLFNWIPPLDYAQIWDDPIRNLQQMIFPALALAFFIMAFIARVTRSAMLEVLREDYIRTARSKGLREGRIVFYHALKNSFLPILTVTGWAFGVFLGGTVIIESIFVLPGMGKLLLDSVFQRDYPVIQAEVFVIAGMILLLNLLIDMLYALLDPRIRYT